MKKEEYFSLAEMVETDYGAKRNERRRRIELRLGEAQLVYDQAEALATKFNLVDSFNNTFLELERIYGDASIDKTQRPGLGDKFDVWCIRINWAENLTFGVAIRGENFYIIGDDPRNNVLDSKTTTEEQLNSALFQAFKKPLGFNEWD